MWTKGCCVFFYISDYVCDNKQNTKLQNAVSYAIDGDQIIVLNILAQKMEEPWVLRSLIKQFF